MKHIKITLLIACMLMLAYTSSSQTSMNGLLSAESQSQLSLIDKARGLLIDAFIQNDQEKVQELHWYLFENFDQENYVTLFPEEQRLLLAWYGDFKNLLLYIEGVYSPYFNTWTDTRTKVRPVYTHNFCEIIKKRVLQELDIILGNLQASSLTQEEKDFVAIYLHYYLIGNSFFRDENYDAIVHTVNTSAKKFIATYPNSEYINLLRSYELKPSDWGGGFGLNLGYSAKTENLSKSLKNDGTVGIYIDVVYKKTLLTTGFSIAFGKAREDIVISDKLVLPKDTSTSINNFYASLGYRIFDDKRFIITPIAGVGTAWIHPGSDKGRKENPTLKQFDYSYGLTANFGVMTDIRLGKMQRIPGQNFAEPSFFSVRLSYQFFYNNFKNAPPYYYNGNLHTITAGINIFIRNTDRVRYK
jgi:hypothetical protein